MVNSEYATAAPLAKVVRNPHTTAAAFPLGARSTCMHQIPSSLACFQRALAIDVHHQIQLEMVCSCMPQVRLGQVHQGRWLHTMKPVVCACGCVHSLRLPRERLLSMFMRGKLSAHPPHQGCPVVQRAAGRQRAQHLQELLRVQPPALQQAGRRSCS